MRGAIIVNGVVKVGSLERGKLDLGFRIYDALNLPSPLVIARRMKGIGDMVSLLSAIRTLKTLRPEAKVIVWSKQPYVQIAQLSPDVDEAVTVQREGSLIPLDDPCPCGVYESQVQRPLYARPIIFCYAMGLPWLKLKPRFDLRRCAQELYAWREQLRNYPRPWIGVILRSAERWKDWPHALKFAKLSSKRWSTFLIDARFRCKEQRVVSLNPPSVKSLVALIALLDVLVTPDTGPLHIAEALNVPTIALFGSMDASVRRIYDDSSVLYVQGPCKFGREPCWYELCRPKYAFQPCMEAIKPKHVLELVSKLIAEEEA